MRERDAHARTPIVDSYKYAALVVSRVVSDGYIQMVKTIPQMYRFIYEQAEKATEVGPFRNWAHQFTATNMRSLMLREKPDVVVCTHAFPCGAMSEYRKLYNDAPPVFGIVTDFAVHGFWIHQNVEGYAVATQEIADNMIARGIEPSRVHVTGIPVNPSFARTGESRESLRERLGLPQDRHLVLLMGGGLGLGPMQNMLRAMERVDVPIGAVVIAGKDRRVERRMLDAAAAVDFPVRVLRFVDNVYDYMHACDAFVTKPGGLSTAEALAAQIPMVLSKPLPGQEERNARVLTQWGAAVRVRSVVDLPHGLSAALDGARRPAMMAATRAHGRPQAARDVARLIERIAGVPSEVGIV